MTKNGVLTVVLVIFGMLCFSASIGCHVTEASEVTVFPEKTSEVTVLPKRLIDSTGIFTESDLLQTVDLKEAVYFPVSDGETIYIIDAGVYVFSGTASEVEIIVEASEKDTIHLVLDGVSFTNKSTPCISVKSAETVYLTLTEDSDNMLEKTGPFAEEEAGAVIFSREDLVLNGLGTLTINSFGNGISCEEDLKITGGSYVITCKEEALEASDSICIYDGNINITAGEEGLHAENEGNDSVGYICICSGMINIAAGDSAIHGITIMQIDDGEISVKAEEGIEGTWIQINGGTINIDAIEVGINAANQSNSIRPGVEINGGYTTISMGEGDTAAVESDGDLLMSGGTLDIAAQKPFVYKGTAQYNGGTIVVNGQESRIE